MRVAQTRYYTSEDGKPPIYRGVVQEHYTSLSAVFETQWRTASTIPPPKKTAFFFNERFLAAHHEEGQLELQNELPSKDDVGVAKGTVLQEILPRAGFKSGDFVKERSGGATYRVERLGGTT